MMQSLQREMRELQFLNANVYKYTDKGKKIETEIKELENRISYYKDHLDDEPCEKFINQSKEDLIKGWLFNYNARKKETPESNNKYAALLEKFQLERKIRGKTRDYEIFGPQYRIAQIEEELKSQNIEGFDKPFDISEEALNAIQKESNGKKEVEEAISYVEKKMENSIFYKMYLDYDVKTNKYILYITDENQLYDIRKTPFYSEYSSDRLRNILNDSADIYSKDDKNKDLINLKARKRFSNISGANLNTKGLVLDEDYCLKFWRKSILGIDDYWELKNLDEINDLLKDMKYTKFVITGRGCGFIEVNKPNTNPKVTSFMLNDDDHLFENLKKMAEKAKKLDKVRNFSDKKAYNIEPNDNKETNSQFINRVKSFILRLFT